MLFKLIFDWHLIDCLVFERLRDSLISSNKTYTLELDPDLVS